MSEVVVDFLLGSGLLSRAIAWWGCGYGGYSHAASLLANGMYIDSHANVIAGVPAGVQVRDPKTEKCVRKTRATLNVSLTEYSEWEMALRENLGDPYSEKDILAFIMGEKSTTQGQWICSGDALRAIRRIRPLNLSLPDNQITPNSLLLILETLGFTTREVAPVS